MSRITSLTALGVVVVALLVTVTVTASVPQAGGGPVPQVRAFALPTSYVFDIGDTPVRLDTRTGALWSMRGDASATGTSAHWWLNVPAVPAGHSGMLEIQRTRETGADGIFLVDVREGTTWILRWRGNQNGAWALVEERRR